PSRTLCSVPIKERCTSLLFYPILSLDMLLNLLEEYLQMQRCYILRLATNDRFFPFGYYRILKISLVLSELAEFQYRDFPLVLEVSPQKFHACSHDLYLHLWWLGVF